MCAGSHGFGEATSLPYVNKNSYNAVLFVSCAVFILYCMYHLSGSVIICFLLSDCVSVFVYLFKSVFYVCIYCVVKHVFPMRIFCDILCCPQYNSYLCNVRKR